MSPNELYSESRVTESPEGDVSLRDMLNAGVADGSIPAIPYELRPVGEIENSRSQPGVPGDEGLVSSVVSRRAAVEPAGVAWTRLEDGSLMYPESRMNDFCDQWTSLDHGDGLNGTVIFSPDGNIRIVQEMSPT